jgi:hypothetical protein
MRVFRAVAGVLSALAALALAGCGDRPGPASGQPANPTAVLGGSAPDPQAPGTPLVDGQGQPIPRPDAAGDAQPQMVRSGADTALAVWVQDGRVMASAFQRARGWSAAQPLESIHGEASEPRLASNGAGVAMAVWRHTVGNIRSLRYSRFDPAAGWSAPDVLPGALPRPHQPAGTGRDAPQLRMDGRGHVIARWPSGFNAAEMQSARFEPGQGWSRAVSERMASTPSASPALPAPSSAR